MASIGADSCPISLTLVSPVWPRTGQGWTLLAATTGLSVVATILLFTAVNMIGALRTAVIDNGSSVWGIALAAVLLGQRMSAAQLFGGALVIGAVLLVQISLRVPAPAAELRLPRAVGEKIGKPGD